MTLRGAIVGAGHVAIHGHVPGWRARPDVEIVAAADPRADARAELEAALPGVAWHASLDSLLEDASLDFVDVCSPPAAHAAAIRAALERGLHVLCEKPLVLDPEELRVLADLAARRGRALAAVHNWRFAPPVALATELVRSGAVGRVRRCFWQVLRERPSVAAVKPGLPNWRLDPALSGGGILVDHGWHAIYVIASWMSMAGPPERVSARLETRRHREWPVEDTAEVELTMGGGEARIFLTWAADERSNTVEIEGELGTIRIEGRTLSVEDARGQRTERELAEPLSEGSHHPEWFAGAAAEFLEAVESPGKRPAASLPESALCLEVIRRARESARAAAPAPARESAIAAAAREGA